MIVEIRGTGTHNKGAELMHCAIRQWLQSLDPSIRIAVSTHFGSYGERTRYGLWTKLPSGGRGRSWLISRLATSAFCESVGLVPEKEIGAVLDASGLAFSDQWGPGPVEKLLRDSLIWRKRGVKSVLLPQAFGPFQNPQVREPIRRALDNITLVYARDAVSLEHLRELCPDRERVKLAPDFTNLVPAADTSDLRLPERFAAIVPNKRMLDRTDVAEREGYLGFLARCVRTAKEYRLTPLVVSHAPQADGELADLLERELGETLTRVEESCPLRIKGVLSRAEVVIGSRFHALVSALSSGVPCIATSWNHKYAMLFKDYGCEEFVLTSNATNEEIRQRLQETVEEPQRSERRRRLLQLSESFRKASRLMFAEVEQLILRIGPSGA